MPGKRDPSQTTITVSMSKKFLDRVDDVCRRMMRGVPRAQIVRNALEDYLRTKHGIVLPVDDVIPPARSGGSRHAVVMEDVKAPPVTETRKPVTYPKPKRGTKKKP